MRNKYLVRQNGFKDCGPSCLLSIMKYYGCEASHEEVTYVLKTDKDGTNAYNIINGSRLFGFDGYGLHLSLDDILNKNISFPIICHVQKDNYLHFIVVYGIRKNKLIIMDPSSDVNVLNIDEFKKIYLNTALFIFPIKDVTCEVSNDNIIKSLFSLIKSEKTAIAKLIIFSIIAIIFGIVLNYYSLIIIDYILPNYSLNILIKITISFLMLMIFKNILNYLKGKYLIIVIENITIKFNDLVIYKLFNLPYQFFKNKSTGEIMSRINDLNTFKEIISNIIVNAFINILIIIISVVLLLMINVKLFMIYFIGMILYFLIVILYRRTFKNKSEQMLINNEKYNKLLNESICGYESIININLKNETLKCIKLKNIKNIRCNSSYLKTLNGQNFLKELVIDFTYICSLFIGVFLIKNKIITIGQLFLFNTIIYYFTEPIKSLLDLEPNISHIKNIYRRINDLLIYKIDENNATDETINGDIVISNVSYGYNNKKLLNNVNIKIKCKSKILICGNSGVGKSTLMKILLKYINEYTGNIYINNSNLKDINGNVILNSFTYVSQNSYINNDTLKNNILFGRNIDNNKYEEVISICNLHRLRNDNLLRDNFVIEDDGFNISGGERQKIILARSLLKNSNYIILDEALSEVGITEEKQIIDRIFKIYDDKTIIYISHKKEIIDMFEEKYELRKEALNAK